MSPAEVIAFGQRYLDKAGNEVRDFCAAHPGVAGPTMFLHDMMSHLGTLRTVFAMQEKQLDRPDTESEIEASGIEGRCPMCNLTGVLVARDGRVRCTTPECPDDDAVCKLLQQTSPVHIVTIEADGFSLEHPLRERVPGQVQIAKCPVHDALTLLGAPPAPPGRWRVALGARGGVEILGAVETIHAMPEHGIVPCCGRTPFELPRTDRIATDARFANCPGRIA